MNLIALRKRISTLAAGGMLLRLQAELERRGERTERFHIALLNVLGPLLEGPESAFIERQWEEFTDEELNSFVIKGVDRERLLLRRLPLVVRVQQIVNEGPRSVRRLRSLR